MSLANEEDIIIPGTTGLMTGAAKEANNAKDFLVDYIRNIPMIDRILRGRIQGIPLEQLVNPSRISSNSRRIDKKPGKENGEQQQRAYENWFSDR